jgi:hypothetical protein
VPITSVSTALLNETFEHFRRCGECKRECQVLWVSPWHSPHGISRVVHSAHQGHSGGFQVDDRWLTQFWQQLADLNEGIRVQIHTHPYEAFHSSIDDRFPIIHSVGFLSLVIPDFGAAGPTLHGAYLAEIAADGYWREVPIETRIRII